MAERIESDAGESVESDPFAGEGALPRKVGEHLAEVLTEQAESIAAEWHRELRSRLGLRPDRIFPSDELLAGAPKLVRLLASSLADDVEWRKDVLDDVADLVSVRRSQSYHLEELLLEVDLLAEILFRRLHAALLANRYVSPAAAATAVARLSSAVRELGTRVVGFHRDQEKAARERKKDVLRTLRHELRDPLTVLVQGAELLANPDVPDADRKRIADRLGRAAERSRELINSLPGVLQSAREEARPAPLRTVIGQVVEEVGDALGARDVDLRVPDELPDDSVDGRNTALVLHNLLTNAVKYSDPAEEERWVRVEVRRDERGDAWVVRVEDNGLGVPPDRRDEIFERFVRVREGRAVGHGLGLAIARDAVRRMGGRISCESELGVGSVFVFTVPELEASGKTGG